MVNLQNTPLVIGALIVAVVLLFGILSILKTTFKTALIVAVVVFALQLLTGIGPQQILVQVVQMVGGLGRWFQQLGGKYQAPSDFREKQSMLEALALYLSA